MLRRPESTILPPCSAKSAAVSFRLNKRSQSALPSPTSPNRAATSPTKSKRGALFSAPSRKLIAMKPFAQSAKRPRTAPVSLVRDGKGSPSDSLPGAGRGRGLDLASELDRLLDQEAEILVARTVVGEVDAEREAPVED